MRGRKPVIHSETKINSLLEERGMSRTDLYKLIKDKFPYDVVSMDALSRIVSGRRKDYSIYTLFRISVALNISLDKIADVEEYVKSVQ